MVTTIPGVETSYGKTGAGSDAGMAGAGCEAGRLAAASSASISPLKEDLPGPEAMLEQRSASLKPTPEPPEPPQDDPQRSSPAEPMPSDQDTSGALGVLLPGNPSFGGSAACAIPILVPPGRCALSPELALAYDSSRANGWLGVGWALDLGAVQRSTRHGLDYRSDDFVATIRGAASELVRRPAWGQGYYGERIEGAFSKFYRNPSSGGWEVLSREGLRYFYGSSAASRQEGSDGIFKWCLDRVEDPNGNFMTVSYRKDQGEIYPHRVDYTGNRTLAPSNRVEFATEDRPDKPLSYPGHDKAVTAQRLKSIDVYAGSRLVRRYVLAYEQGRATGRSRLLSITQYGTDGKTALPPAAFGWQEGGTGWDEGGSLNDFGFAAYPHTGLYMGWEYGVHINYYDRHPVMTGDFNGDGRTDIGRLTCTGAIFYVRTPEGGWKKTQEIVDERIGNCTLIEGAQWSVITGDFNGDGRTDIGRVHDTGVRIYVAAAGDAWHRMPDLADFGAGAYPCWSCYPIFTGDFDGDGRTDIARAGGSGIRVYRSKGDGQWASFASIEGDLSTGQGYTDSSLYPMLIGDFNGDGRTDIGRVHSSGMRVYFSDPATGWRRMPDVSEFGRDVGYVNAGQYPVFIGDFNGDGKSDVGRVHTRGVGVVLSKGDGQWERVSDINGDLGLDQGYTGTGTHPMVLGDFNGDGKIDIGRAGDQQIRLYRFQGVKGWAALEPLARFTKGQGYTSTMKYPILTGDFDGDAKTDIARIDEQQTGFSLSKGPFPDLLAEMKGNLGGGAQITYAPSSHYANTLLPFRVYTVSSITTDDGLGGRSTSGYTYAGGYFDAAEREFRGFGYVRRQDPDGSTHETWTHQDRHLKGRPYCQVHRGPDGGPILAEEHSTWEKPFVDPGETSVHARLSWKQTCSYDYEGGKTHAVSTEQGHSYDETNGHLVCTWQRATGTPTLARMWTYQNLGGWLWRLAEETLFEGRAAGKDYDWIPVRKKRCGYAAGTGNRLWEEPWLEGGQSPRTTFGYDACGNLTRVTDPLGRSTHTAYDTETCTFPVKLTYPRTQTIDHVVEKGYDPRFGSLLWEKDENGGIIQYAYDPLGRLVQTAYPDGGITWSSYGFESLPRYTATARLQDSEGSVQAEYVYVDGLGRPIQTISFGEEGKPVIAYRHYDAMGREDLTAGPYFLEAGKAPARYPYRQTVYDECGRPLWVIGPDGEHGQIATAYTYQGLSTTVWGPDGTAKTILKDALGRAIQVIEQAEKSSLYTRYTYNAAGDLLKVVDHEGKETQIVYDTLGRKTAMQDPDMGAWRYAYDPSGNLTAQTDARGLTTRFGYDALNRLVLKAYSNGEPSITFTYDDTSIPNGRGRLRKAARGAVSTRY
ncbi:FG-GAP-like repeat-containing protein, partial [Desulfatiglans anilini]|uniref:FG-GAP-like repeat-containing protein n=1 Tax=Desulfatiglans anilini TaxID=90728 RepID=UPI000551AC85